MWPTGGDGGRHRPANFFDRVNHDILVSRLARRVEDRRVIQLIYRYCRPECSKGELCREVEGTPQGGPLSPLLSNILLDELDKELERRGTRSSATRTTATSTLLPAPAGAGDGLCHRIPRGGTQAGGKPRQERG